MVLLFVIFLLLSTKKKKVKYKKGVCQNSGTLLLFLLFHLHYPHNFAFAVITQADEVESGGIVAHIQGVDVGGIEPSGIDDASVCIGELHGHCSGAGT